MRQLAKVAIAGFAFTAAISSCSCSGSDSADPPATAPASSSTTATAPASLKATAGNEQFCTALFASVAALRNSATPSAYSDYQKQSAALVGLAPAEVKQDVSTTNDAAQKATSVSDLFAASNDQSIATASDNVTQWANTNCGADLRAP